MSGVVQPSAQSVLDTHTRAHAHTHLLLYCMQVDYWCLTLDGVARALWSATTLAATLKKVLLLLSTLAARSVSPASAGGQTTMSECTKWDTKWPTALLPFL